MLFNSFQFIFAFLPIALIGFQFLGGRSAKAGILWLALLSLGFYAVWSVKFLPVLACSVLLNYVFARALDKLRDRPDSQHRCLLLAVTINLGALCYFKYLFTTLNFFADRGLLPSSFSNVVLPLGISFFTFTQIAYLIDLKQGEAELESFPNYLFFVTFFPHLIAGPILHHSEIMPQLSSKPKLGLHSADLASGLTLFAIGLFKKVAFADNIAPYAATLFNQPAQAGFAQAWFGLLCYAMQLYFDFSGYSDMAIGLARMFSIRFPLNFNSPLKATSIIDFWQRWHMTLTRYITVYLYNPMSLAAVRRAMKKGRARRRLNFAAFLKQIATPTLITMFLAGIWHGAGLQFILFGVLHGIYISINHAWRMFGNGIRARFAFLGTRFQPVLSASSVGLTVLCALSAWVFFRAKSVADAAAIFAGLIGVHGLQLAQSSIPKRAVLFLAALFAIVWLCPNSNQIVGYSPDRAIDEPEPIWRNLDFSPRWQPSVAWAVLVALVVAYSLISLTDRSEFLYFQF